MTVAKLRFLTKNTLKKVYRNCNYLTILAVFSRKHYNKSNQKPHNYAVFVIATNKCFMERSNYLQIKRKGMIFIKQITKEEAFLVRESFPDEHLVYECSKRKNRNGHTYYTVECGKVERVLQKARNKRTVIEKYPN